MYNGYANEDSYYFDVVWANDSALYEAIKTHTRQMRPHWEVMTDQTLGRNVLDAIKAAISDGGWGWRSCPDAFTSVPRSSFEYLAILVGTPKPDDVRCDLSRVNEEEFGANIREAMGLD